MSQLLEKILSRDNMNLAYKRVKANKGAGGVDGVEIEELYGYIKENWKSIKEQIEQRQYKPQPVRRVEIPKPNGGVMAILRLLDYLNEGCTWIVDIDLEKFFDNVPQDRLMSLVHNIINDGDTESLIRKYLKAGVMTEQGYERTDMGTPQGGNLSPLLSNIMLNELDKELESRGLNFVRYADDCITP